MILKLQENSRLKWNCTHPEGQLLGQGASRLWHLSCANKGFKNFFLVTMLQSITNYCWAALSLATVTLSSSTCSCSDFTYSTVSSSMSAVLVCLSMLGTRSCNFFMRSLIRVLRTRSAMLRGWVAQPRFARARIWTVPNAAWSSTLKLVGPSVGEGKLMCLLRLPNWPFRYVKGGASTEPLDVSLSPAKPRSRFPPAKINVTCQILHLLKPKPPDLLFQQFTWNYVKRQGGLPYSKKESSLRVSCQILHSLRSKPLIILNKLIETMRGDKGVYQITPALFRGGKFKPECHRDQLPKINVQCQIL